MRRKKKPKSVKSEMQKVRKQQTPRKSRKSSETTLRTYNSNKFENLDKFLDTFDHPKLNQEDISHLNKFITQNEIEAAINSLPKKKKSSGPNGVSVEFYQTIKEKLIPTLLKLLHKIEREGILPNSFYEVNITLIQNQTRHIQKKRTIGQSP
jgi:hypothetical protein